MTATADLVLKGGRIFRSRVRGLCAGLAVKDGRVAAAGSNDTVEALIGPRTRVIDLRGRAALPGLNDAHQHLLPYGLSLRQIDLRPERITSMDALLAEVRAWAERTPKGDWIYGGRYDHFLLAEKRHPTRAELDRVAPEHPVYLKRTCGHMGVANSRAFAAAGVDAATADPPGGRIERRDGTLTGLLQETAQDLVFTVMPPLPVDDLVAAIDAGGQAMLARGITSVMDAGVGMVQGGDDLAAYRRARAEDRLPVRAYLALTSGARGIIDACVAKGVRTGDGDEWLKIGPVKIFMDGSAGGKTAAMSQPYCGNCGAANAGAGILIFPRAELQEMVARYGAAGFQIAVHAIGDRAIEEVLLAFEAANDRLERPLARPRIEHCGFPSGDQLRRMADLGVVPAPQPIFIHDFGDLYLEVLGPRRAAPSYPMRRWIDLGILPAASTDCPVCPPDMLVNLRTMLNRASATGAVVGAEEVISLAEAIAAMTEAGAHASFSEAEKGTLEPGQLADIAVLDRDLFDTPVEEIPEIAVDLTFVDGRLAFSREGEAARAS